MSDGYAIPDETGFARPQKKSANKVMLLKVLVTLLLVVMVVQGVVYFAVLPCMAPAQIQFYGLKTLQAETLRKDLQITDEKTWFSFDIAAASRVLASNHVIANAAIEKRFPDQIVITIGERVPAAVALVTSGEKTVPVQIDKSGVIFRVDEGMPSGNIPIISGLTFKQLRAGVRLHSKLWPLMERLDDIQQNNPAYFAAISEIQIAAKEYGNYDLILYPMRSKTKVLVDRTLNDVALNYMIVILDVLNSFEKEVLEVDLRHGAISYKIADGGTI